jgi:hypothetical protein
MNCNSYRLDADRMLDQLERAGAVGSDAEAAALFGIDDQHRIVEQVLGHRDLRLLQVQTKRSIVCDFDRVGVPQLGFAVDLVQHVTLHQAKHGGAGRLVQRMSYVPGRILGGELTPVVPLDVTHSERPGLEVVAGGPAFCQIRPGNVVLAGLGQILDDLPANIRILDPGIGVRRGHLKHAHGNAQDAALRDVLGPSRSREVLACHFPDEGIGCRGGHAKQGRVTKELAAVDLALRELRLQLGNVTALSCFGHVGNLPFIFLRAPFFARRRLPARLGQT